MFPALLMPALIGGGLGLLANRKDPLKGALVGAGMGAAGGYFAPGLLGSAGGAAEAAESAVPAVFNAAKDSQAANVALGLDGGGLLGTMKKAGEYLGPIGNAANAAGQVQGMFGHEQPMQPPPPMAQTGTGAQTLAQLAQMGEQQMQNDLQAADQARRKRRMGLLGVA